MYELEWGHKPPDIEHDDRGIALSRVDIDSIASIYFMPWREHCIECTAPECYMTCPMYSPKKNHLCARFQYGILANPSYRGLFGYGADISFKRWGKLEANLLFGGVSVLKARWLSRWNRIYTAFFAHTASFFSPLIPIDKWTWHVEQWRERFLHYCIDPKNVNFDEFIIEAWNPSSNHFKILIEYIIDDAPAFRSSSLLSPGYNFHKFSCYDMNLDLSQKLGRIMIHPENDQEVRVIFTWLDFVRYKPSSTIATVELQPQPAAKIKCVAWDLDNTLWQGILIEDGPEAIQPIQQALSLIKALDERGIIQTIVSKNDHESAWAVITKLGLEDYFIYPAINWGAKSQNIRQIANELNIDVDTFALIDDSPFERGEVKSELPQVRTYSDQDISDLLELPEFNVPITEATKTRRLSYLVENQRKRVLQAYSGNYEKFLLSCNLETEIFTPFEEKDIMRCLELLQRTNQLNLSTHRYSESDFRILLDNKQFICVAIKCRDRFGEYGTVGFLSIDMSQKLPMLFNFVLSCRVARKKVENAIMSWLLQELEKRGYTRLEARYIRSPRNAILLTSLQEVGFKDIGTTKNGMILELQHSHPIPCAMIVHLEDRGVRLP